MIRGASSLLVCLDRSFRPLAGRVARDLAADRGNLFYLFDDSLLCNELAGKYYLALPRGQYRSCAILGVGTRNGYYVLDLATARQTSARQERSPAP